MDYSHICDKVKQVALKAGEYIAAERKTFTSSAIEQKGVHDLVSYVDKTAERIIVDGLSELIPQAGFITEEGTASQKGEIYNWVIDPLDGTTNFVHGLPPYCVCIALMRGDDIVVGVVYEITLKEMFYAWEGSDAYLNGEKINVSNVDSMQNALIAIGFSYSALTGKEGYMDRIARYQRDTNGIRRIGSSATDLVYVACGRFDAFSQDGLSPWDVAAGALIAQRAGAVVCDNSGGNNYVFGREVVAVTPGIYEQFMKTLY